VHTKCRGTERDEQGSASEWLDKACEYMGAFDGVGDAPVARQGVTEPRRSGGDLFVEAEVLFDCGDADCEKPRSTVERIASSDALRFLFVFFAAIYGKYIYHGGRLGHE
jgi:hypothetical protein